MGVPSGESGEKTRGAAARCFSVDAEGAEGEEGEMKFGDSILVIAVCATFYGYCANLVKLVFMFGDAIGAEFVLRCIGLFFFPMGAILGFF